MKIQLLTAFIFLTGLTFAQGQGTSEESERKNAEFLVCKYLSEDDSPVDCFDLGPSLELVELLKELFGENIQYIISLEGDSITLLAGETGLTVDEMRQRIASITLPDGRWLLDVINVEEGELPPCISCSGNPETISI